MSYNIGARYELVGRVTKGTSVVAYIVKDKATNKISQMEKGVVEQLALNKQIYNCNAQIYNNLVNLKGINCRLNQLPKYDNYGQKLGTDDNKKQASADLKLIGKIQCGREVQEYVVIYVDDPENKMKIPRDMVLRLAQEGRIINAKSQMNGNSIMLRGTSGNNLAHLEVY